MSGETITFAEAIKILDQQHAEMNARREEALEAEARWNECSECRDLRGDVGQLRKALLLIENIAINQLHYDGDSAWEAIKIEARRALYPPDAI